MADVQNFINVVVTDFNGVKTPTGCKKQFSCDNLDVKGTFWRTPNQNAGGEVVGYTDVVATGNTPPTTDSFKVAKITSSSGYAVVVLSNTQTADSITVNCGLCCGVLPSSPNIIDTNTVPAPITGIVGCPDSSGNMTYQFPILPDAGSYTASGFFNGAVASPATITGATEAALAASAVTNWASYGTWTQSTPAGSDLAVLKLVSATTTVADVVIVSA